MPAENHTRGRGVRAPFPVGQAAQSAATLLARLHDPNGPEAKPAAETLEYEVELITPLFGGGVKPGENDLAMPIRGKSLRGQLRFWWRLLAANGGLAAHGVAAGLTGEGLYDEEAKRWGGTDSSGKPLPSRIAIRVLNPSELKNPITFEQRVQKEKVKNGERRWVWAWETDRSFAGGGIAYALFPAKHGERDGSQPKALLPAGLRFTVWLDVLGPPAEAACLAAELRATMKWWATFGGVGARVRRGVGAVLVREKEEDHENAIVCLLDDDEFPKSASDIGFCIKTRAAADIAKGAWDEAISRLRDFRQAPSLARRREGRREGAPGCSFWPEPNLIRYLIDPSAAWTHRIKTAYPYTKLAPRAALGQPINIRFNDGNGRDIEPHGVIQIMPDPGDGYSRMASPIILRPVARRNGTFTPCALRLPGWEAALRQRVTVKNASVAIGTIDIWPDDPANRRAAVLAIHPLAQNCTASACDPLSAFMEYFAK